MRTDGVVAPLAASGMNSVAIAWVGGSSSSSMSSGTNGLRLGNATGCVTTLPTASGAGHNPSGVLARAGGQPRRAQPSAEPDDAAPSAHASTVGCGNAWRTARNSSSAVNGFWTKPDGREAMTRSIR